MSKNKKDKKVIPAVPFDLPGLGWDLFSASGQLGYYLLYNDLSKEKRKEDERFE